MNRAPQSVRFEEMELVCDHYFEARPSKGTSHRTYKTPWKGDPRVNIQRSNNGGVKAYQVKQVLSAIERLELK